MECNLLLQDVGSCTDKGFKLFEKTAYWTEYDNIDRTSIVEDGAKVSFQLKEGSFYEVYDGSKKPFEGDIFKCEESSKHGYKIFSQYFNFPLRSMAQYNTEFVTALSKDKKVVIILPQQEKGTNMESAYIVLGLSGGLKLNSALSEASGESAWEVVLQDYNTDLPMQFLGSATKTVEELFDDLVGYEFITGLQIKGTNGVVRVHFNQSTKGILILPDGERIFASNIMYNWEGDQGNVTIKVPQKKPVSLSIEGSDFIGILKSDEITVLNASSSTLITGINCKNAKTIDCSGCTGILASGVKVILDNAYSLYLKGEINGVIDASDTGIVTLSDVSSVHGISYDTIKQSLIANGWSVTIESV